MTPVSKETATTHTVSLRVNGTDVGKRTVPADTPLSKFVTDAAREFGVRSFCVMGDGNQVGKSKKDTAITQFQKVDIIAKDARGTTQM